MLSIPSLAARCAATRSAGGAPRLLAASQNILPLLEAGQPFDTGQLRAAMISAFGTSDAEGGWDWKAAYDACEGAQTLLLRAYGRALMARAGSSQRRLATWERISRRVPTHTRRSETGQSLQQFSTPLPLAYVAAEAASIAAGDLVLEPSAGTGMLAIQAELAGGILALNELDPGRADFLDLLFPGVAVTRHDAASIDDRLDDAVRPDIILMNPPFSAVASVDRPMRDAALRHIASALARLRDGGRLVAIVGANCSPEAPTWRDAFARLAEKATLRFSTAISGKVYAKHGTTTSTRLLVFDKDSGSDSAALVLSRGEAPDLATLLQWVEFDVPRRPDPAEPPPAPAPTVPIAISGFSCRSAPAAAGGQEARRPAAEAARELSYSTCEWQAPDGRLGDTIYEPYALQSLCIDGARPHPSALVQSAAILVKPTRPDIVTNLVINTNRRTYHLELRATPTTYMAGVSWSYPQDELIALRTAEAERARAAPVASGIAYEALNFAYRISGDKVPWRPIRVFDDGRQLFVEFGAGVATGEMPPLFVLGDKNAAELVNYRAEGRFLIVDRLFERGELRLGSGRAAKAVRIEREVPRRRGGK